MHFSQTTSFSCILGRAVKSTARVQLGLNHDYKPETLQQKHLQCTVYTAGAALGFQINGAEDIFCSLPEHKLLQSWVQMF